MTRAGGDLTKGYVLAGLFGTWDDIDTLLSTLVGQQWQAPTPLPGWTVHDVVAHVIGTESVLLGVSVPEPDRDVLALPHVHNEVGARNEAWVRHLRPEPPESMLERFRAVTGERRRVLQQMPDEDWTAQTRTPAGPDTYARFMRIRTFDCWMHEQDIRDAVAVWASDEVLATPGAALTLDEITAALGYVVAKLGQAKPGSRVAFELTGPLQRTLRVAVDESGRAQAVEDFDDVEDPSATTTIRLDGVLFTRLVGGRTTVALNREAIEMSGDTEAGWRIADHLRFVI
ncbi:MAG TPA: maleylpyruvate isomerase N-terminal domain-containing protein [Mycobacterium sp.]|nr:maleylpyruvate isomerase N-terminal domain-containing protein [Mycobacterium sp.]